MSRASSEKLISTPKMVFARRVTTAASRPPVTASGIFQRCNGLMRRLRPTPVKNTRIAIVKVRSPGTWIAVILGPYSCDWRAGVGSERNEPSMIQPGDPAGSGATVATDVKAAASRQTGAEAIRKMALQAPHDAVAGIVESRSEGIQWSSACRVKLSRSLRRYRSCPVDRLRGPVPGRFVEARGCCHRQGASLELIDCVIGELRAHDGKILDCHRASTGDEIVKLLKRESRSQVSKCPASADQATHVRSARR